MNTTKKWEYHIETLGTTFKSVGDDTLQAVFNDLGQEGWEVFNALQFENSGKIRILAKRPIEDSAKKRSRGWP